MDICAGHSGGRIYEPPKTVRVEIHIKAIAIDRDLHPIPADSQVATVNNFSTETLKAAS